MTAADDAAVVVAVVVVFVVVCVGGVVLVVFAGVGIAGRARCLPSGTGWACCGPHAPGSAGNYASTSTRQGFES